MKVMVLCGGMGTRLREETQFIPKPMVTIGERPILWHIMKLYSHFGFNQFVLCLGYKGDIIRRYFMEYDILNHDFTVALGTKQIELHDRLHDEHQWEVTLAETGAETMTGGRILRAMRYVNEGPFLVTYGDAVADLDLKELVRYHHRMGKLATVTAVQSPSRFGRIDFDVSGRLAEGFLEKPQAGADWINGGFFVFDERVRDYLHGDDCVLERDALAQLAQDGELAVYKHTGFWHCMDTLREVELLRSQWASGQARWPLWNGSHRVAPPRA